MKSLVTALVLSLAASSAMALTINPIPPVLTFPTVSGDSSTQGSVLPPAIAPQGN